MRLPWRVTQQQRASEQQDNEQRRPDEDARRVGDRRATAEEQDHRRPEHLTQRCCKRVVTESRVVLTWPDGVGNQRLLADDTAELASTQRNAGSNETGNAVADDDEQSAGKTEDRATSEHHTLLADAIDELA